MAPFDPPRGPSASSSSSSTVRLPPTGPKALRNLEYESGNNESGPSYHRHRPDSHSFPAHRHAFKPPGVGEFFGSRDSASRPVRQPPTGPSGISRLNGASRPSSSTGRVDDISSSSSTVVSASGSREHRRSKSPVKQAHEDLTKHARISISLPMAGSDSSVNGIGRARPPHLDLPGFEKIPKKSSSPTRVNDRDLLKPARSARPPSPPRVSAHIPSPPPPPRNILPRPPPSPPPLLPGSSPPALAAGSPTLSRKHSPDLPNGEASSSRGPSPRQPSPPRRPTSPPRQQATSAAPLAPPAFHFRELPLRRSPSTDSYTSSSGSESGPSRSRRSSPTKEKVKSPRSPSRISEPEAEPAYEPPASVRRRPGLGNWILLDKKQPDGQPIKRLDGDGIEPEDPRLKVDSEVRKRGRGSMRCRPAFHSITYEWDDNATWAKPPSPPTAVLVTGLHPLTTVDQITKFFRVHGRIKDIEAKMDERSGSQLGICWVNFEGPASGQKGSAHDVATRIVRICDGQRVGHAGDEKIKVVLDGRRLRTKQAVKDEMERRYKPKPKPAPTQTSTPAPSTLHGTIPATPSSGAGTPRVDAANGLPSRPVSKPFAVPLGQRHRPTPTIPLAPRSFTSAFKQSLPGRPTPPPRIPSIPFRPVISASFVDAPFAPRRHDRHLGDSYTPGTDRGRSRSRSRSQSRGRTRRASSHPSSCSTCSLSDRDGDFDDEQPAYKQRPRSPIARGRPRVPLGPSKDELARAESVKGDLNANGFPHVYIDAKQLPITDLNEVHLGKHFQTFKPARILSTYRGWYILFDNERAANQAKFLDGTAVQGHRITTIVEVPPTAKKVDGDVDNKAGLSWRSLTIAKKNRAAPLKPQIKVAPKVIKRIKTPEFSDSSDSDISDAPPIAAPTRPSRESTPESTPGPVTLEEESSLPLKAGAKRSANAKTKPAKKARITSPVIEAETIEPEAVPIIPVAEVKVVKAKKPAKKVATLVDKLIESHAVQDEEDAYWFGQALAAAEDTTAPDFSDDEEELDTGHPLFHAAGSWRAEGWKKIPQIQKSSYLPQRNRAAVATEDATALTTGRTARVTGRRLAHDMESHRKTVASATAESDLFAFNQLRIRKKQLRFARSAIEGYGLYAMETIQTGEMVCEYVGEIVRSTVAEIREQRYLKQGIGSSYLFRIDGDMVCDATFKGSVSRLINHSCDPSASAKIISINGQSKIVIYAKRTLHPGEEILYDYKFPLESDPALRVPCLCGAATCRGWLN